LRDLAQALKAGRLPAAIALAHRMEGAARMAGATTVAHAVHHLQQGLQAMPPALEGWQPRVDAVYRALDDYTLPPG
jgi:two-component system sensor histidine kinase EvgS